VVKLFNKNNDCVIKFVGMVKGIKDIEELRPKPASKFLPDWWKNIPQQSLFGNPTIKKCPGVHDFLKHGYILPMWANVKIITNESSIGYEVEENKYGLDFLPWTEHPNDQLLNYGNFNSNGQKITHVLNMQTPWRIITPPGYSTMVLPLNYEFNENFTVMSGIFDTDIFHTTNVPTFIHTEKGSFDIKMGNPLLMYVPFKRIKNKVEFYGVEDKEHKHVIYQEDLINDLRHEGVPYRKIQQKRDKK